jgi:predicted DNA-binding ribbon-helix-helix protein
MIRKRGTLPSAVVKRSVKIAGQNTSVSLEDAFWRALREIAVIQDIGMSELVSCINKERDNKNLSSAIRVFVLAHYQRGASQDCRDQHQGRNYRPGGDQGPLGRSTQFVGPGELVQLPRGRHFHDCTFATSLRSHVLPCGCQRKAM